MSGMLVTDVSAVMQVSDVAAICCQRPLKIRIAAQTAWTGACVDSPLAASRGTIRGAAWLSIES